MFDLMPINVADPKIFIGLLIGGAVPFLFSALAIRAVGRTAGVVVQEVRKQFADGKIMKGEKEPEYGPVIDICTEASLRELATPALLAVLTPVVIGFGIDWKALGAFLAAVILVGQLMANYLSNAGGAWDNAKKYIEDGHHGGKGSDAHKAAVIGDTVGDPFKDTAGPALNPLIKVMNLGQPADAARPSSACRTTTAPASRIAAAALVVLIGAIVFTQPPEERHHAVGRSEPITHHSERPGPCARAFPLFTASVADRARTPRLRQRMDQDRRHHRPGRHHLRRDRACSSASSCRATRCCSSPASWRPAPPTSSSASTTCRRCGSSCWSRPSPPSSATRWATVIGSKFGPRIVRPAEEPASSTRRT